MYTDRMGWDWSMAGRGRVRVRVSDGRQLPAVVPNLRPGTSSSVARLETFPSHLLEQIDRSRSAIPKYLNNINLEG
jgi:hypothetical protein